MISRCGAAFLIPELCFFRKHDTDGTGAGVAADGSADIGFDDMFKLAVLAQTGFDGIHAAGFRLTGGDEDHRIVDVVTAFQLVGNVFADADGKTAAILFDDFQLTVDDGQTGFDAEDICAKRQDTGAAADFGA